MKITMNETRKQVIDTLKKSNEPLTLKEIGERVGKTIQTGSTNALLSAGIIKVVGSKKVPVTTYKEVNVYSIGDLSLLEKED